MSLFFIFSTLVIWGMAVSVAAWLACAFPTLSHRAFTLWLPIILTVLVVFGISYTRTHYHFGTGFIYYAAYILFGFIFLAFCTTALFAFIYFLTKFIYPAALRFVGPASVLVTLIVWGLSVWGGFSAPQLKKIHVNSPQLPKLKIALLSDSHLGRGVSLNRFKNALARLADEKPDVLFVLGDVFEYGQHQEAYAQQLKNFPAPLGVYGVFGNHEYYMGYENSKNFFKNAGITLLENELISLPNGLQIAGVKDIKTARVTPHDISQLLQKSDPQKPLIVLSHTPSYAEEISSQGADFMFSGHTHNGQIWPFKYFVRLQFPRVYGLFDVNGMKFYITSGMFYWGIPLRFLTPAELPIIEVN